MVFIKTIEYPALKAELDHIHNTPKVKLERKLNQYFINAM